VARGGLQGEVLFNQLIMQLCCSLQRFLRPRALMLDEHCRKVEGYYPRFISLFGKRKNIIAQRSNEGNERVEFANVNSVILHWRHFVACCDVL